MMTCLLSAKASRLSKVLNLAGLAAVLLATEVGCSAKNPGLDPESLPNKMVSPSAQVDASSSADDFTDAEQKSIPPQAYTLSETADTLGKLPTEVYLAIQKKWVGSEYPACNFFLITALCEAGFCKEAKPFYIAADFDQYFIAQGWKQIDLEALRTKAQNKETMDVVFQKPGVTKSKPGHVLILDHYNAQDHRFVVAEGSLGTVTNEVKEVSDDFLLSWNGGFKIFVRQPQTVSSP
jgi:hypothetical protein